MLARKIHRHFALCNQRPHEAAVELGEEILGMLGMQMRLVGLGGAGRAFGQAGIFLAPAQNPDARPRRDDERDEQRPEHRRAGADRNRPHVRPHQPADERHRQHRRDHGERGEDGGIADFTHRFDGDVGPVAALVLRQMKVADDVFDHDDGVIHQNADGEDQREERDAVQREAVEIKHQQRERERGGNGDADDARFAPAERQPDQQRHADHRDAHVQQQFVGFLRGGFAVVARDGDRHVGGNDAALERLDFAQDFVRDGDGIRAGPLGDAERDGGFFAARIADWPRRSKQHILARLFRAVHDLGDFAQINRFAAIHADDHVAHVLRALQERAGLDDDFLVLAGQSAGGELLVRLLQHRDQAGGR